MGATLLFETLAISGSIILLCGLPLFSKSVRSHSKLFFLLGTGALAGICFFELVPEIFHMGGNFSLLITGIVWVLYSIIHIFHLGHHEHDKKDDPKVDHQHSPSLVFLGSMIAHCLASGMLLVLSDGLAKGFGRTVFLALMAHKTYEALTVSSILLETQKNRSSFLISISAYALSFPSGVALTYFMGSMITQNVALFATSLAVGTLLGCLIFDFLMPSLSQIKNRRHDLAWVFAGLVVTQAVFWVL
jgi:zinc transporter ZupT